MTDIVERLRLHPSWRDSQGELNSAPNEAADEIERLRGALYTASEAIDEYFRYFHGGEMRGSYDGKPERDGLRRAVYKAKSVLNSKGK